MNVLLWSPFFRVFWDFQPSFLANTGLTYKNKEIFRFPITYRRKVSMWKVKEFPRSRSRQGVSLLHVENLFFSPPVWQKSPDQINTFSLILTALDSKFYYIKKKYKYLFFNLLFVLPIFPKMCYCFQNTKWKVQLWLLPSERHYTKMFIKAFKYLREIFYSTGFNTGEHWQERICTL